MSNGWLSMDAPDDEDDGDNDGDNDGDDDNLGAVGCR